MTRPAPNYRDRRRELARELADVPAPPPPADLLDAIRSEIPADLDGDRRACPRARTPVVAIEGASPRGLDRVRRRRRRRRAAQHRPSRDLGFGRYRPVAVSPRRHGRFAPRAKQRERAPSRLGSSARRSELARGRRRPALLGYARAASRLRARRGRPGGVPTSVRRRRRHGRVSRDHHGPDAPRPPPDREALGAAPRSSRLVTESMEEPTPSRRGITVTSEAPMVDKLDQVAAAEIVGEAWTTASTGRAGAARSCAGRKPDRRWSRRRPPPSTGGTAEPNDAPVGDMFFRSTDSTRSSTRARTRSRPSRSTSTPARGRSPAPTSSAARCRRPRRSASRSSSTRRSTTIRRRAEVSSRWWRKARLRPSRLPATIGSLRFAVKGRELDASERKPAVLTFVVDVSGSMAQENRLGLVKQALGMLLDELHAGGPGRAGRLRLQRPRRARAHQRPRADPPRDRLAPTRRVDQRRGGAAPRLRPRRRAPIAPDWNNRVVLCSDGVANVGATGPESILERIGREARRGIELTTVGFGMGNYNDALMEQLADQGDGRYHYVDTLGRGATHLRARTSRARSRPSRRTPRCRSSSIRRRWSGGGSSATRTATSPTATSATTASTPARSAPVTR